MSASYSTSKVEVKVKVVSCKVSRRPRSSQVSKGNKSTAIREVTLTTRTKRPEVLQQIKTNPKMAGTRAPEETTATRKADFDTRPKRTGVLKASSCHDKVANRNQRSPCTVRKPGIDHQIKVSTQTHVTSAKRETVPDSRIKEPPRERCPRQRSSDRGKEQPTHTLRFQVKKELISQPLSPPAGNRSPKTPADQKPAIRKVNFDTHGSKVGSKPREASKRCAGTRVTSAIQQAVPDSRITGPPQDRRPGKAAVDLPLRPPCENRNPTREGRIACFAERSLDMAKLASREIPNGPFLRFFKAKVSLSQVDISRTSDTVNNFIPQILDKIREKDKRFALRVLNTGSYYEHLKVSRPCEFDVMLVFDAHILVKYFDVDCPLRLADPAVGFASLKFKKEVIDGRKLWGQFLTRDEKCLSPWKIVEHFFGLVQESVKAMSVAQRRRFSDLRLNAPAVTITIDGKIDLDLVLSLEIEGWPRCANGWGDFATDKTWPTKGEIEEIKIKKNKYHLVAKPCDAEDGIDSDRRVFWRISFSEAEKTLLSKSASEKKYYRIAKAMFEAKKEHFEPLTSYLLKTLFLNCRRENPRTKNDESNLGKSVVMFFASLVDRLKGGRLPHFFVQRRNLLSPMPLKTRSKLAEKLGYFLFELVENPKRVLEELTLDKRMSRAETRCTHDFYV